ncbi:MAG: hypothetical protein K8L99_23265 [Anaerolineae bacterium]|nr:hypothetical protein [Anaerolineae bacterium]
MDYRHLLKLSLYILIVVAVSAALNPLFGIVCILLLKFVDAFVEGMLCGYHENRNEKRKNEPRIKGKHEIPAYLVADDGEVLEVVADDDDHTLEWKRRSS